jgi:hypothetical protein
LGTAVASVSAAFEAWWEVKIVVGTASERRGRVLVLAFGPFLGGSLEAYCSEP